MPPGKLAAVIAAEKAPDDKALANLAKITAPKPKVVDVEEEFFQQLLAAIKGGVNNWSDDTLESFASKIQDKKSVMYMVDKNGLTPLHWAIVCDCPGQVVRMLLGLGREVARQLVKGRLPLHMAIEANCNPEILTALLDEYPDGARVPDMDMRLPIEMLLNNNWGNENPFPYKYMETAVRLLELHPDSASLRCGDRTLLQICLEHDLGETIILEVLRANRCAAAIPRRDGMLPLHCAVVKHKLDVSVVVSLIEAHPQALLTRMRTPHAGDMCVIEHLIRSSRPVAQTDDPSERRAYASMQDKIECVLTGGCKHHGVCHPKAMAYARAAAMGLATKLTVSSQPQSAHVHNHTEPKQVVLSLGENALQRRQRLKLYVKPFAQDVVPIEAHVEGKVEDLRAEVEAKEGTPASQQCLLLDGVALEDGVCLSHYNIKQECVIDLRLRFELLHQALRNRVFEEITLGILEIRPAAAAEQDRYGALPLHLALQHRTGEIVVQRLLHHSKEAGRKEVFGGAIGEYPLHHAIVCGYSPALIKQLLEGTQPGDWCNDGTYNPSKNKHKRSSAEANLMLPLLMTMEQPNGGRFPPLSDDQVCEIVSMLLTSKCSIQARDRRTGFSALDVATTKSEKLFSQILLETLAVEPDAVGIAGSTGHCPLHVAVMGKACKGIVNKLCEFRPDVLWMRDSEGRLPIHLACSSGASPAVIRTLLWHLPESVQEGDARGRLPLQIAVSSVPPPGVVFELVRNNRSIRRARNHSGHTPLEQAVLQNSPPHVVRELLQADPGAFKYVNLLTGNWPNNAAAIEAIRIVKQMRTDKEMRKARHGRRHHSEMTRTSSRRTESSCKSRDDTAITPNARTPNACTPQCPHRRTVEHAVAGKVDPTRDHNELKEPQSVLEPMFNALGNLFHGAADQMGVV